jgi:dTDP-4-amino-4,6-dideoxygalactose transaminase
MPYQVPFIDPASHYAKLKPEIDQAITECLTNGDLVNRRQLKQFEQHLADFVGVKYAVGVNSGYHALLFALMGAGVETGHEVITVAHTFVATVSAIVHCGAQPILIDVGADFNMDAGLIEQAITSRTKALLPVHLNGRLCDMDSILAIADKHGLAVIEDAAQALGATFGGKCAGSQGRAGCFSFYPFKVLGGFGDGGAITTNDPNLARMATLLRYNGEDRLTGEYHYHGQTALLDNVQAAVLDVKLRYLPEWIGRRRQIAELYHQGLSRISQLRLPRFDESNRTDIYQNYVIRTTVRDHLRAYLKEAGIETLVHWPKPMWEHAGLRLATPHVPQTVAICREALSLPMSAETTDSQIRVVVEALTQYFSKQP